METTKLNGCWDHRKDVAGKQRRPRRRLSFVSNMLQFDRTQSEVNREPMAPEMLSGAETVQLLVSFIRRQFSVILFVTILTTALGVIYLSRRDQASLLRLS